MNNIIDNDMINKAFIYAEFIRDLCRKYETCYECPFCWIGDTGLDYHCSLDTVLCNPRDWDLAKCRLS